MLAEDSSSSDEEPTAGRQKRTSRPPDQLSYATIVEPIPESDDEAMKLPKANEWKLAMDEEVNSLVAMEVWKPKESQKKAIGSRWVYTIKSNGTYKARFVTKGFSQVEGIN